MTDPKANLPKEKQTVLGLYVTAKEAYEKWQAAPEQVKIIDVRTPEEFLFVGSPDMAWKIPVAAQSYEWDAEKEQFPMKPLPDFVARVQTVAKPDDTHHGHVPIRRPQRHRVPICSPRPASRMFTTSLMAWRAMANGDSESEVPQGRLEKLGLSLDEKAHARTDGAARRRSNKNNGHMKTPHRRMT